MRSLTLLMVFAILCPAHAERPIPPRRGAYQLSGDLQYWKNTRNFSNSGSSTALDRGGEYQNFLGTVGGSYDFTRYLRTSLAMSFAHASSVSIDQSQPFNLNLPTISRTNSGLNEVNASALGWFNFGDFSAAPLLSFTYPFWRVDEDSNNPLLGEGAMRVRAGSWGVYRLGLFQPFVFAGYEFRDGGRSSLLPYNAGVHFRYSRFWIQAEYRGTITASEDGDTDERGVRDLYTTRVNGGSFRYYGVNPETSEAAVEGGFRYKGFGIYAGFATTVTGSDAADGNLIYGGITYNGRLKLAPPRASTETSEENFEIEQDQYDETLFQEEGGKKIKRKVRKQPSVDKLLHETEKELQQE